MASPLAERSLIYDPVFLEAKRYAATERFGRVLGGGISVRVRGDGEIGAALRFVYWLAGPPASWSVSPDSSGGMSGVIEKKPSPSTASRESPVAIRFAVSRDRDHSQNLNQAGKPMIVRGDFLLEQGVLDFSSEGGLSFRRSGSEELPLPLAEGDAGRYARMDAEESARDGRESRIYPPATEAKAAEWAAAAAARAGAV